MSKRLNGRVDVVLVNVVRQCCSLRSAKRGLTACAPLLVGNHVLFFLLNLGKIWGSQEMYPPTPLHR